jgi:hypothetical protein
MPTCGDCGFQTKKAATEGNAASTALASPTGMRTVSFPDGSATRMRP